MVVAGLNPVQQDGSRALYALSRKFHIILNTFVTPYLRLKKLSMVSLFIVYLSFI